MQFVPSDPPYPDLSDLALNPGADRQAMLQNNRATATAQVRVGNYQHILAYLHGAWTNFIMNMTGGQVLTPERQQPPVPPFALVLSPPDADGLVAAVPGDQPVMPIPPLPPYSAGIQTGYHNPISTGAPSDAAAMASFQSYVRDSLVQIKSKLGIMA